MFTGLVEAVGSVEEVVPRRGSTRIGIASELPLDEMADGESVAVDGVCLTVAGHRGGGFYADVVAETLSRTTLARVRPGHRVNLERALKVGDRLGGHWIQGHVDATVPVVGRSRRGDDRRIRVGLAPALRRYVAEKGSVALQGVSLTVARLAGEAFEVALIPETVARTTLWDSRPGDSLNLEVDLLVRYLERLLLESGRVSDPGRGGPDGRSGSRRRSVRR